MAATAGRSLPLLLCRRRPAALTAAGCFPALGRRRQQQQQRHRTVAVCLYGLCLFLPQISRNILKCLVDLMLLPHIRENLTKMRFSSVLQHAVPIAYSEEFFMSYGGWSSKYLSLISCLVKEVTVVYQNGLPVISVNLPSRRERCQFTLKPISDSVGVFLQQLQAEDRGIDRVAIYSADGTRVASSTGIDLLLLDDFKLIINDVTYHVRPPKRELLSHENATTLNDVKTLVQQLYTALCIEEHQLNKEKELIGRLEELKEQLAPLEKVRMELSRKAEKRTTLVLWGGLAYMATQFGILARLTWWEYSWDIMEPVTYFITYGSAMAMYAYFVMTRQEYVYPDARDRQYLLFFHKGAKKTRFDLEKYNRLKDAIAQAELDLKRLRDPLQVHLPIQQIDEKD